jgi:hypothetical protein
MTRFICEAHAACLPFVTRHLRGARRRRTFALAILVTLATLLLGLWVAQSSEGSARRIRTQLRWETPREQVEVERFAVFADFDDEYRWLQRAVEKVDDEVRARPGRLRDLTEAACAGLAWAASTPDASVGPDLRARATEALRRAPCIDTTGAVQVHGPRDPTWVQRVLDMDLRPQVRRYASPLGVAQSATVVGWVAGGVLGILLLAFAPLLAGIQMAQEVHDNTLQPLTGTALTARHLAAGLPAGPLAVVGLVGLGPAVFLLVGALAGGRPGVAVASLVVLLVTMALLVVAAQLTALAVAKERAPGIVTLGLALALGALLVSAAALGLDVHEASSGLVATLPGAGAVHLWHQTFVPGTRLDAAAAWGLDLRVVGATVGFVVVLLLGQLVTERRLVTGSDALLSRKEAAVGAAALIGIALTAVPPEFDRFSAVYLSSLLVLVGPLQLLLMARVPGGERPASLRTVPITALLTEYAVVLGVHVVLALLLADSVRFGRFSPGGLLHIGWAMTVLALASIRGMATPSSLAAKVWLGVVALCVVVELGIGAAMTADGGGDLFPLAHVPALVGLVYLAMLVLAPWSLLRGLTRSGAQLR